MSQDKKYTYITLPDGRRKRVPIQHGGKTLQEIDRDFDTQRMKINNELSHDSWYDFLEIEPDYLVEKCKRAGIANPQTLEYVNTWGDRVYNMPPLVKSPTIEEIETDPEGAIKKFEDKLNGPYKTALRRVYDNCDLRDNLKVFHKDNCENLVCRPFAINKVEDLPRALTVSPSRQKDIYLPKCVRDGYLCDREERIDYDKQQFTNIANGGAGDCLFIAFANYLRIINECLNGRFLKPGDDISDLEIKKCDYFKIQSGTDLTQKLRSDVIRYLDANRRTTINNQPLSVSMASLIFEKYSNFSDREKKAIYESFLKHHPRESKKLQMNIPITKQNFERIALRILSEESEEINILINYLTKIYLRKMSDYSEYAGQIEIIALALVNNVSIEVLQENSLDTSKYIRNMGYTIPGRDVVYLHHTASTAGSGAHFDVMIPLPEEIILANSTSKSRPETKYRAKSSLANRASNLEIAKKFLLDVSPTLRIRDVSDFQKTLMGLENASKLKALSLLLDNGNIIDNIDDIMFGTVINDFIEITMSRLDAVNMKKFMHKLLILSRRGHEDQDSRLQEIFKSMLNIKFAKLRPRADKFAKSFKVDDTLSVHEKMETAIVQFFAIYDIVIDDVKDPLLIKLFKAVHSVEETEETEDMIAWAIITFLDDIYYMLLTTDLDDSYLINIIGIDIDINIESIIDLLEKYKDVVTL